MPGSGPAPHSPASAACPCPQPPSPAPLSAPGAAAPPLAAPGPLPLPSAGSSPLSISGQRLPPRAAAQQPPLRRVPVKANIVGYAKGCRKSRDGSFRAESRAAADGSFSSSQVRVAHIRVKNGFEGDCSRTNDEGLEDRGGRVARQAPLGDCDDSPPLALSSGGLPGEDTAAPPGAGLSDRPAAAGICSAVGTAPSGPGDASPAGPPTGDGCSDITVPGVDTLPGDTASAASACGDCGVPLAPSPAGPAGAAPSECAALGICLGPSRLPLSGYPD